MAGRYYRAQILLEPEQHDALVEIAERQGRSVSEVVREFIQYQLEKQDEKLQRELEALEKLRQIREEAFQEYGMYPGDPVAEIREEQEREMDRMLGLESQDADRD